MQKFQQVPRHVYSRNIHIMFMYNTSGLKHKGKYFQSLPNLKTRQKKQPWTQKDTCCFHLMVWWECAYLSFHWLYWKLLKWRDHVLFFCSAFFFLKLSLQHHTPGICNKYLLKRWMNRYIWAALNYQKGTTGFLLYASQQDFF